MSIGITGTASAADMAVKALPMAAPAVVYNWTGGYVGLNLGGTWNDSRADVFPTGCFLTSVTCGGGPAANPIRSDSNRLNQAAFTGGVQAGYNWQRERWVFGVEGDINYNGVNDGVAVARPLVAPLAGTMLHAETDKLQWFGTVRGRVGIAAAPNFLIYGTGGLAFGQVKSASAVAFTTTPDTYAGSLDQTRFGWTVGGGGEWMFAQNWSVKAEYLYVDLGKASYTDACVNVAVCGSPPQVAPGGSYQTDLRVREHVARVGVNYHFATPVVAKY
ncbi:porin family protein [Bradyrhizobium sp. 21]|nr:porin family protein [Bradyrhizobium sp. 21]